MEDAILMKSTFIAQDLPSEIAAKEGAVVTLVFHGENRTLETEIVPFAVVKIFTITFWTCRHDRSTGIFLLTPCIGQLYELLR